MSVLENFDDWKDFLNKRVEQANKLGMSNDTISKLAYQIGDYLSENIDPKNNEDRLLKELWDVSDEEQQKVFAQIMVNFVHKQ